MGRVKLQLKRIENNSNRQVTFSKRKHGLIKKAYELSVLCDIDLALIVFSPSGRLSHFSSKPRIEDVLNRYINLPDHEIIHASYFPDQSTNSVVQNKEYFLRSMEKLRIENESDRQFSNPNSVNSDDYIKDMQRETLSLQQQLQVALDHIRMFEPDLRKITSMAELESCERTLVDTLTREYLLNNNASYFVPSRMEQATAGSLENEAGVAWLADQVYPLSNLSGENASTRLSPSWPQTPADVASSIYSESMPRDMQR